MEKFKDNVCLRGVFKMKVYKGEGKKRKLLENFEEENLIVNQARDVMARLIAGEITNQSIKFISFGTNGNVPVSDDEIITNPFTKEIGVIFTLPTGRAIFEWKLTTAEANGLAIMEFGLLTSDKMLFARRTRIEPIHKDSDISLEGQWTIIF